jgi:6-phosphogluconolactonase
VKIFQCVAMVGCFVFTAFFQICGMSAEANSRLLYIGTYTGAKSKGIYSARFDSETGKLSAPELAVETKNPSFLALHPNGKVLYAVGEIDDFQGMKTGAVSSFAIDGKSGKLTLLNQQPSAGAGPCHLAVDKTGKCVLVANYGSGSFAALLIEADGKLGETRSKIQGTGSSVNKARQSGPHAHQIVPDPANKFALGCDLGLDKVFIWQLGPDKAPLSPERFQTQLTLKPGAGPRHLAFHPNGVNVYAINELDSTIAVFNYHPTGALYEIQTVSTLPNDFHGNTTCAEIQVHPSGKFVYGSNRGHDSVAVFSADAKTGKLTFVEHQSTQGKTPRHFAIDPTGKWLLAENQDSDSIVIFQIDQKTGKLTPTEDKVEIGAPVCIQFVSESAR